MDTVTARKDHVCRLCGKPIPKGEKYVYRRIAPWECDPGTDQEFFTYKAHVECDQIWTAVAFECDYLLPDDAGEWQDLVEWWRGREEVAK